MHELGITQEIVRIVEEERRRADPGARVIRVSLRIGRLTTFVGDSVKFYFSMITEGTRLEGAEITVTDEPLVLHCAACGARTERDEPVFECGECGSSDTSIASGREMIVESIELDS
ncbi:MAG: hydrogenase maturation nickel metallochaperone HypA [bacterium]